MKQKLGRKLLSFLLTLAMVVGLVPGMSLTAYADNNETLLTTITPTSETTYSETTSGVVTVSHDNDFFMDRFGWVWSGNAGTMTVSGCKGYTITKCIFKQSDYKSPFTVSSAPFELHFVVDESSVKCQENSAFDGVSSIKVYGYASASKAAQTITAEDVTVTYGDTGKAVSASVTDPTEGGGTISYAVKSGSEEYIGVDASTGALTIKKVPADGIAYVTVTAAETDTHDVATKDVAVIVSKADPTNTVGQLSAFRGQTLADVALPTAENGAWSWEEDTTAKLNDIGMTTYHAKFTPNDTENYNILENVEVKIQVSEKPMAVPATVTANSRTYDGTEKPLVNVTGKATGGEMQYALGENATTAPAENLYTTSIPAKTDAGTYYVWYKVVGDENHKDTQAVFVTSTIRAEIRQTVTFKVVNGSWNDETTADKTVTLTGYEGGDTLKLTAGQIPTVGSKPNDTYKAGSWDVTPSTDTAITAATTYTYTYAAKEASVVTKAPEAKTLTYTGSAQELVTAGTAEGGTMQYTLGTEAGATQPYTTSIPADTAAGTYYVWYMVKGNENYNDSTPVCIPVTISEAETCTITFDAAGGIGSMDAVQIAKGDKFTFPTSAFVPPENQVFAHWKIGKNQYVVNDEITVNADLIVSAVWAEKKKEIKKNVLTSVPNELKNTFSSIDAIENALLDKLSYKGMIVSKENSEFYDAVLMVQRDDGSWVEATKDDFPKGEKLSVILPYPDGTGMNTHNFRVAHMFSQKMYGHNPGEIEIPPLKKLKIGIQVDLDGLSPVAISWTKIDDTAIDSLPQTGDTERPLLYGLAVLAALIGLGLLIKKK